MFFVIWVVKLLVLQNMNLVATDNSESASLYFDTVLADISFVVHCLSQCMHSSRKSHLNLVLRVLIYLKRFPGKVFVFPILPILS